MMLHGVVTGWGWLQRRYDFMGDQVVSRTRSKAGRSGHVHRPEPLVSSCAVIVASCFFLSGCGGESLLELAIPALWGDAYADEILTLGEDVSGGRSRSTPDTGSGPVAANSERFHTLDIAVAGRGDTHPPPGPFTVPAGSIVVVSAEPSEQHWFAGWEGDVREGGRETTVVVDRDKLVRAVFRSDQSALVPQFHLPWPAEERFRVSQGNGGSATHMESYAWDIPMPLGSPVMAAAAGMVVNLRDWITGSGGVDPGESLAENFIAIDHGRGLKSFYAHLDFQGVTVNVGELVPAGKVIGYSGNTGFSTAPHLHYEVRDVYDETVSTGFIESPRANGIAQAGDDLTSRNVVDSTSIDGFRPSTMPRHAFAMNNIELLGGEFPAFLFETETAYMIRGRVLDGRRRVCAALVDPDSFETVLCELTPVRENGEFTILLRIPSNLAGLCWFGVISGDGGANGLAPVRIQIVSPFAVSDAAVDLSGR